MLQVKSILILLAAVGLAGCCDCNEKWETQHKINQNLDQADKFNFEVSTTIAVRMVQNFNELESSLRGRFKHEN